MKNIIALATVAIFGTTSLSAQKNTWTIGLYTGLQGQLSTSIEKEGFLHEPTGTYSQQISDVRTINRISYACPAELIVQYKITDYFSVASGIGYALHKTQGKREYPDHIRMELMENIAHKTWVMRPSCNFLFFFNTMFR